MVALSKHFGADRSNSEGSLDGVAPPLPVRTDYTTASLLRARDERRRSCPGQPASSRPTRPPRHQRPSPPSPAAAPSPTLGVPVAGAGLTTRERSTLQTSRVACVGPWFRVQLLTARDQYAPPLLFAPGLSFLGKAEDRRSRDGGLRVWRNNPPCRPRPPRRHLHSRSQPPSPAAAPSPTLKAPVPGGVLTTRDRSTHQAYGARRSSHRPQLATLGPFVYNDLMQDPDPPVSGPAPARPRPRRPFGSHSRSRSQNLRRTS